MTLNVKLLFPALVGLSVLTLAGCTCVKPGEECADPVLMTEVVEEVVVIEEPLDTVVVPLGIGEARTTEGMLPVYFNFDSSAVGEDQKPRVQVNADFMDANVDYMVRIEGNTDSRGTDEYNMALGERRALSAQQYLMDLGVEEARLTTVSYGKERLLLNGQSEDAWSQNRRCDFVVAK
ncbi:OmpA family protein [Desulfotalea psychrophila]|uniref:Peptidoglycan-associated lipoprotein n=1 Tax=Desulfotalea psychrophila (strain LSv54 / DSM 12343) TaxID=177439 RepID=Q6AJ87_DESPS|nr:OmpA family protein [Desulfotalea psychrophila]CAG37593.1 related to peptidoglycan-associated lipoprotein [Precursor] [Desulfotalea psychrophila LSv54]